MNAQAQCTYFDNFTDNNDGTVTDPRNGLIWKRCAEGSDFVNGACIQAGTEAIWFDAMQMAKANRFLGQRDWRIPTRREIEQVVGSYDSCKSNSTSQFTASKSIAHAVRSDGYLGRFWSSSPSAGYADGAWVVYFNDGYVGGSYRDSFGYVRLVRAGQLSGGEAVLEFNREYTERVVPVIAQREASEREAQAQKTAQENQRREEERQRREEERKWRAELADKNPQAMYLSAGKYYRNGDSGRANQLYEAVIARFPSSDWAVKASDQLNSGKRLDDSNRANQAASAQAARQAQELENQASQRDLANQRANLDAARNQQSQCSIRKDSCDNSCRPLSGSAKSACWDRCKSIC